MQPMMTSQAFSERRERRQTEDDASILLHLDMAAEVLRARTAGLEGYPVSVRVEASGRRVVVLPSAPSECRATLGDSIDRAFGPADNVEIDGHVVRMSWSGAHPVRWES